MLIGFALIIIAIYLCCGLLFRLSIHALPFFVAFAAASATYRADYGIILALVVALLAGMLTMVSAQIALGLVRCDFGRAVIGLVFALPAAIAGYYAVHGIAAATMPASFWQIVVSLVGSGTIAVASWSQWVRVGR